MCFITRKQNYLTGVLCNATPVGLGKGEHVVGFGGSSGLDFTAKRISLILYSNPSLIENITKYNHNMVHRNMKWMNVMHCHLYMNYAV